MAFLLTAFFTSLRGAARPEPSRARLVVLCVVVALGFTSYRLVI